MTNVTTIEIKGQLNHDEALVPELKPLLDACRKGDRLAQKQLYERYHGKLMGRTVDYTRTSFNGLAYDVTKQRLNLDASQFRLGVVFDCSVDKGEKVVNKPSYWEEEEQILYMDPQDSSKVFVPCPCEPCDERSSNNNYYNNPYINIGGRLRLPRRRKVGFPGYKIATRQPKVTYNIEYKPICMCG